MAKNKELIFLAQGTYPAWYIIIALSLSWLFLVIVFNDNMFFFFHTHAFYNI